MKNACIVAYNDFDTMLKDENIDTVHICTPIIFTTIGDIIAAR